MEIATEALKTGLRVLTAISHRTEPDAADVQELRRLAPLLADAASLDEIACDVIQQALKRRSEVRSRMGRHVGAPS